MQDSGGKSTHTEPLRQRFFPFCDLLGMTFSETVVSFLACTTILDRVAYPESGHSWNFHFANYLSLDEMQFNLLQSVPVFPGGFFLMKKCKGYVLDKELEMDKVCKRERGVKGGNGPEREAKCSSLSIALSLSS